MKYATKIKQIILALIGNFILGAGVAMESQALLGTDPAVSFSQAAAPHLGITIGQMITVTNVVLLLITFFIKKSNIGLGTLIVVLLNQYPVDLVTSMITYRDNLFINILWVVIGCVFIAIGCNVIISSNLGMGIYDAFLYGITSKTTKSYTFVRYIVDGIFLLLTFILKGYIGIGTIIPYLIVGNLITLTQPYITKLTKLI